MWPRWNGIPIKRLAARDAQKIVLELENRWGAGVSRGPARAGGGVAARSAARAHARIRDGRGFLPPSCGPPAVGKDPNCASAWPPLFDKERPGPRYKRISWSATRARLLGAPAYVAYEEGASSTERSAPP